MERLRLDNVTLLGIDCVDVKRLQKAMDISQEHIDFAETKLLTSIKNTDERWVEVDHIGSIEAYSEFCIKDLVNYVDTDYVLLVQHDGFVLNPQSWSNKFLEYDYIGAPWHIKEEFWFTMFDIPRSFTGKHVVGNGGFCLRSKKFLEVTSDLAKENKFSKYHPEDLVLSLFDKHLLDEAGLKFASPELAAKFSLEGRNEVFDKQFGFHGLKWTDISKWIEANPKYGIELDLE